MVLVLVLFINIITVCIVIVIGNIVVIMYFLYLCDCRPYSHSDIIPVLIAIRPLIITIINDNAFLLIIILLKIMGVSDRAPCVYVPYEKGVSSSATPPLAWSCFNLTSPFPLAVKGNPPPFGRQGEPRPLAVKANSPPRFGRQGEPPPLWPSQGNLPL